MAVSSHLTHQIRRYSQQLPQDPYFRAKLWAVKGLIVAGVTLPYIPPYLATKKAKADGTYQTRPGIGFQYYPRL